MRTAGLWLCLAVMSAAPVWAAAAPAEKGEAAGKDGVALTIYNQNFAVVKEVRTLKIDAGAARLEFKDVARDIDPTTVQFKSLADPEGTRVIEQNYEFDVVTAGVLLH